MSNNMEIILIASLLTIGVFYQIEKWIKKSKKKAKLKSLYIILLNYYKKYPYVLICNTIRYSLRISEEDRKLLYTNFIKNRPTRLLHINFYVSKFYNKDSEFWWSCSNEGFEQRKLFIEYLVNNFKV